MAIDEKFVNVAALLGHIEIKRMPMITAGRLFGFPHQIIDYDGSGNVRKSYFTQPAVWARFD